MKHLNKDLICEKMGIKQKAFNILIFILFLALIFT